MRKIFVILFCCIGFTTLAQSKAERELLSQTMFLKFAAFKKKDCNKFNDLISDSIKLSLADGKILNKEEAITFVCNNKSKYEETIPTPFNAEIEGDLGKSSFQINGKETKSDGAIVDVNLKVSATWIKFKKNWKLLSIKIENQ